MKKFELFTVPQKERVEALETTVISWMNDLKSDEHLVVGIPQVLGTWDKCIPLVVGQGMQEQFQVWLSDNADDIRGPVYNLPPLIAGFLCMVIDVNFDPRTETPLDDASRELLGTLASLGKLMNQHESQEV